MDIKMKVPGHAKQPMNLKECFVKLAVSEKFEDKTVMVGVFMVACRLVTILWTDEEAFGLSPRISYTWITYFQNNVVATKALL